MIEFKIFKEYSDIVDIFDEIEDVELKVSKDNDTDILELVGYNHYKDFSISKRFRLKRGYFCYTRCLKIDTINFNPNLKLMDGVSKLSDCGIENVIKAFKMFFIEFKGDKCIEIYSDGDNIMFNVIVDERYNQFQVLFTKKPLTN